MRVRLIDQVSEIAPIAWDALAGENDPFVEHAFLRTLEESGSVGQDSGWTPVHVTAWDGERLVGALPLYLKDHSFGEYIFDWGWADAAARLGLDYYPKLVSMIPVTPVTGRRFLVAEDVERAEVVDALVRGAFEAAEETAASSIHFLFLTDEERRDVASEELMPRLSFQFHWENAGYESFDDFLTAMRSSLRKQVRKERRRVAESPLEVRVLEGPELGDAEWEALALFYRITCGRYGSYPYLTPAFFDIARERIAHRVVAALAYDSHGAPVAGSFNLEKGQNIYGRYWGCREEHDFLHFELCYYQLIERAIARKMSRFEAGAQGTHKLRRGLMPRPIHSVHWVRHPILSQAVAEFLPREAHAVRHKLEELAHHGPFKRGDGG